MSREKGALGEAIAKTYLEGQGYRILAQNATFKAGELDLVAQSDEGILVFVEVKAYGPGSLLHPLQALTAKKRGRLLKAASLYLLRLRLQDIPLRFDLICIQAGAVSEHFQNVFGKDVV
ncbi:MAG: YraN family protein [Candidatus Margulisiibacteriota bacterium]